MEMVAVQTADTTAFSSSSFPLLFFIFFKYYIINKKSKLGKPRHEMK